MLVGYDAKGSQNWPCERHGRNTITNAYLLKQSRSHYTEKLCVSPDTTQSIRKTETLRGQVNKRRNQPEIITISDFEKKMDALLIQLSVPADKTRETFT